MVPTKVKNFIKKQYIKRKYFSHEGSGENIFLIEDDDGLRKMLDLALTSYGYNVVSIKEISEVMEIIHNNDNMMFDLLMGTITSGSLEWLNLLKLLPNQAPDLPVLLTCGYLEYNKRDQYTGITLLIKPYTVNELLSTIESILKQNDNFKMSKKNA